MHFLGSLSNPTSISSRVVRAYTEANSGDVMSRSKSIPPFILISHLPRVGRPKFRRSRTIFNPEQLDILEQHFAKYKYPDVKRRRAIAEEVGLPEERVQVWFQNRRAKNKRQTDQEVKLQELVDQAISTNTGNEQKFQRSSDNDSSISRQNGERCQESPFGRPRPHDADKESENYEVRAFHGTETKSPRLKECELIGNDAHSNTSLGSRDCISEKAENPAVSQNSWLQPSATGFGTPEAQVIVQSIDQDLLCKVANILSASNDANSLITEWSQAPNKTHTSNIEEQLRHFAEHNQQVLRASQDGNIILTSSSQTTLQKD